MRLTRFEIENFRTVSGYQPETVVVGGNVRTGENYRTPFRIDTGPGLNLLVGPNGVGKSNILAALRLALVPDSEERLKNNLPRGTKKRTINIETTWAVHEEDIQGRIGNSTLEKLMRFRNGEYAISRRFSQAVRNEISTFQTLFRLKTAQKLVLNENIQDSIQLEQLCVSENLFLSLGVLPNWIEEATQIEALIRKFNIPLEDVFAEFVSIVNTELQLSISFPIISDLTNLSLNELILSSVDVFGPNPLSDQGAGVQAALVYSLVLSVLRTQATRIDRFGATIILDEPENGLHIQLQKRLIKALVKTCEFSEDLVFIVTTNSPFLIPQDGHHRLFEIEVRDSFTARKNFLANGEIPSHWLETESSVASALWEILGSKSIARTIELFRRTSDSEAEQVVIVEGFLDKFYIDTALSIAPNQDFRFRVLSSGEGLEFRNKKNFEKAGVWLLALQVLLAYGWASSGSEIVAISDADPDAVQTLNSLGYLVSNISSVVKSSNSGKLKIRLTNTNFAEESWENNLPVSSGPSQIWIATEIEDLWPMTYLERFFSQCSANFYEPRGIWESTLKDGSEVHFVWQPVEFDTRRKHLPQGLSNFSITGAAKSTSAGGGLSFYNYLVQQPPSESDAEIFLSRLKRLITKKFEPRDNFFFNFD